MAEGGSNAVFATTHWSVVLSAGRETTPQATDALEKLCHAYWYPLYAYVRRRGYGPDDAQDLTQSFFPRLLERDLLSRASPLRGRPAFLRHGIRRGAQPGRDCEGRPVTAASRGDVSQNH